MCTNPVRAAGVAVLLGLAGCGGAGGDPSSSAGPASGSELRIKDFHYQPASTTVRVGTTMTWRNGDSVAHTVTSDDSSFDSGNLAGGRTFTQALRKPGTFGYHCSIHTYMTGTIMVHG